MKIAIISILVAVIIVLIVLKFRGASFFDPQPVSIERMAADKVMRDQAKLAELRNQIFVTETRNQVTQKKFDDMLVKAQRDFNNQKIRIQRAPASTRTQRMKDLMAKQRAMEQKIMVNKENNRLKDTNDLMRLKQELANQENVVRISIQEKEMVDEKLALDKGYMGIGAPAPIRPEVMPPPIPAPIQPEVMPPPIPAPIRPEVMPLPIPAPIRPEVMPPPIPAPIRPAPAPMEKGYMGIGAPVR